MSRLSSQSLAGWARVSGGTRKILRVCSFVHFRFLHDLGFGLLLDGGTVGTNRVYGPPGDERDLAHHGTEVLAANQEGYGHGDRKKCEIDFVRENLKRGQTRVKNEECNQENQPFSCV